MKLHLDRRFNYDDRIADPPFAHIDHRLQNMT